MGGLLGKKKKSGSKKPSLLSILAIGNSAAGKTALIVSYQGKEFENQMMTVATEYVLVDKTIKNNKNEESIVKIKIWDSPRTRAI